MNIQTKFDCENLNNSTLEADALLAECRGLDFGSEYTSENKFKKVLSRSPHMLIQKGDSEPIFMYKAKSEHNNPLRNAEDDSEYCAIVKKYKLERRINSKTKPTRLTRVPSPEKTDTPIKKFKNRTESKMSFSSTPKTNDLSLSSKECIIMSKKLGKKHSSSSEDLRQLSFVSCLLPHPYRKIQRTKNLNVTAINLSLQQLTRISKML